MAYLATESLPLQTPWAPPPPPPSISNSSSRISPAVLFTIVILAAILLVSGLLHLLVRFLTKKGPIPSRPRGPRDAAGPTALQQLFRLHDAGLDQASIDALPVFPYRDVVGPSRDPFDCAVCLCEFSRHDRLRLLPACGHAFHLDCIDTWLLSSSTCPLCRGALLVPGTPIEEDSVLQEEQVVSVRLGKFRSNESDGSSSSNLDARRCYSMGSYQYVLGDANLRVALGGGDKKRAIADEDGRRLGVARKGESLSVSKIWLWRNNKGKFLDSSDASPPDGELPPWMNARRSLGNV